MKAYNSFRLIGIVYKDSKTTFDINGSPITRFTLAIRNRKDNSLSKYYVPLIAYGELGNECAVLCRNGNIICVEGEISTKDIYNSTTGINDILLSFNVTDVMLLHKATKKPVSNKEFNNIVRLYKK